MPNNVHLGTSLPLQQSYPSVNSQTLCYNPTQTTQFELANDNLHIMPCHIYHYPAPLLTQYQNISSTGYNSIYGQIICLM